ncbi:MAG: nicotinate-nucleotide adenylyltransferase [Chloroflexi bacterium]|nr:nicotinate-nucleotide adenylyltransferase [Chloroflexota bacterium]
MMRIGIFGGTFDPPHLGHLILAMEAHYQLGLDRLLWVPTQSPPHKQGQEITSIDVRLQLVRAAIQGNPDFELSCMEIDRPGPQYAADTVRLLAEENPGAEICYLIGGDSLNDFPDWYDPATIVATCSCLGVMRRPGQVHDLKKLEDRLPGITAKLQFVETPMLEIASSTIRDHIHSGIPYRYYVPESVFRIIENNRYYQ